MSSADPAPPDPDRPTADPAEPAPSYARLGDALSRALAPRRWWRHRLLRSAGTGRLRSGVLPVLAALAAVLILSLLGITAPWNSDPDPARGGGALDSDDSVLVSPPAPPAAPPSLSSRLEPVQNSPTLAACPRALSVAVSADIATLVQELAGPLTGGTCPQVSVSSQGPAGMAGPLTYQGGAPDAEVWIPASSLSLRLAGSTTFPSTGTSIARSPIVIALPKPVADSLTGFPVWILIYNELTAADGEIQRMSMPDHRTTVGALAQVTLQQALLQLAEGNKNNAFVHLIALRNSVATTQAVAGGTAGDARVISALTGDVLARYQLTDSSPTFVNDVTLTPDAAWFTDYNNPVLYRVPLGRRGALPDQDHVVAVPLGGDYQHDARGFNGNGISRTPDGKALLLMQSITASLFRVDPATGEATIVDLGGAALPGGDGILLHGRTLYVVQNVLNQVAVVRLNHTGTRGKVVATITDPGFDVPTTVAAFGNRLYLPNFRFGTEPTPETPYTAVAVPRR